MSPIEALDAVLMLPWNVPKVPGAVVARLSGPIREALQRLTSDEARSMRAEDVGDPDPRAFERQLKRRFDKHLVGRV